MKKIRVLFVCTHNSARSQMAEAFLNHYAGELFEAKSAGFEPGPLNPLAVKAMAEDGLDISGSYSKSVFDLFKAGELFDWVITVCDESAENKCPLFPGIVNRLHLSFPDPASFRGTDEEKLAETRRVRDLIKTEVLKWAAQTE